MTPPTMILVCSPVGYFADDVHGVCACGAAIVWRPHGAPPGARRVCMACATALLFDETEAVLAVTEDAVRELELYHARTKDVH